MGRVRIHGAEYPIKKIFSDDFVCNIPLYQRPYAWTTEHAGELLDDLFAFMGEGIEPTEADEVTPYFLGSIVLIKGDEPDAQVVDGQQRLTTLALLLATLRALIPSESAKDLTPFLYEKGNAIAGTSNRYRLTLRERDAQFFQKYIQNEKGIEKLNELNPATLSDSQKNIYDNTQLFLHYLKKLSDMQRLALAQFIINRCLLVVVSTPDLDSAYRIERYGRLMQFIERGDDVFALNSPLHLLSGERRETYEVLNGDIYRVRGISSYTLLRLDTALADGAASYDYPTITVEHVLPQNPAINSEWMRYFPTKEEHDRYVHRLGNLVLLSRRKNTQAQNYDFALKKQRYFTTGQSVSPFALTTQVLQYSTWTPGVIEQRQHALMNLLVKIWGL